MPRQSEHRLAAYLMLERTHALLLKAEDSMSDSVANLADILYDTFTDDELSTLALCRQIQNHLDGSEGVN